MHPRRSALAVSCALAPAAPAPLLLLPAAAFSVFAPATLPAAPATPATLAAAALLAAALAASPLPFGLHRRQVLPVFVRRGTVL